MSVRYIPHDRAHLYRMSVGGNAVSFGGPNGIWVDCMTCDRRDRLAGDVEGVSDAEAQRRFENMGWTVLPTRCPDCLNAT